MAIDKLIFVYNANSGRINSWLDSAHKIISPSTYQCKLCELTHGAFTEHDEWSSFRESLLKSNIQLEFLHKDEFKHRYWSKWLPKYDFPIILSTSDDLQKDYHAQGNSTGMNIFMTAGEMNELETTKELIIAIKQKLKS